MKEFHILLILDNLETVMDARISEFLTNIPSGTKILITSRIGLGAYEVPVKLDPLDVNESVQLVRALARVRSVSPLIRIPNNQLSKYCKTMKNNPGYIKWFVSAIQAGQRPEDVLDNPEIFLQFCMSNVYKYLSEESKKVLKSMQAVPGRHSQAELGFLNNNISTVDLQRAIQQLLTTNMVKMASLERGSTYESTYDISELARAYLDISHPLDASEFLFYSKRRNRLVSASDAFSGKRVRNLYSPRTIVTRSKRDFVVAKELFDVMKAVLDPIGRKNLEDAKRRIEEARRLAPNYYEVRRVEAFLHTAINNYTAARASYQAALELEPSSSPLHYWYGIFLLRYLDDTEGSLIEFERANSIDPDSHQIRIELARVNLYLKNFEKARSLIDSLLKQVELLDEEKRRIYDIHLQYYARFADYLAEQHENIQATIYCERIKEEFEKCSTVLKDDNMVFHIKKAAYTIKRCIRYLDSYPDYKERAQDVYNWIEHL
jgi:LuxR family transcriptional regulator, glucitol operon activator